MPGEVGGTREQEAEANAFAMELLMPRTMLEREYRKLQRPASVEDIVVHLARIFHVEPSTMQARLLNLGYVLG